MLTITLECNIVFSEEALEEIWSHDIVTSAPHLSDELGPSLSESSICSKRVLPLLVDWALPISIEEEFGEFPCIRKTLNTTVHIASIAKIRQSNESLL